MSRGSTGASGAKFHTAVEHAKTAVHYGWIPLILAIGTPGGSMCGLDGALGYVTSDPKPDILRLLNPLS